MRNEHGIKFYSSDEEVFMCTQNLLSDEVGIQGSSFYELFCNHSGNE